MLTTLFLAGIVGFYGSREVRQWVRDLRCMYLGFCAAVQRGNECSS